MTNSEQAENSEIVTNIEPSHNGPICPLYLKNSCPHGTSGKKLIDDKECDNNIDDKELSVNGIA